MNPKTIIIFVLLVFAGVLFVTFGLPRIRDIQDLRSDTLEQAKALEIVQEKFESTKGVISQFQSIEEGDRRRIASALPKSLDLPNLLVHLDALVSSSGLLSEAIDARETVINITVLGNYESLKVFLNELEQSLRIFDVETVSFTEDSRFSLSIKTYFQQ